MAEDHEKAREIKPHKEKLKTKQPQNDVTGKPPPKNRLKTGENTVKKNIKGEKLKRKIRKGKIKSDNWQSEPKAKP